MQIPTVLNETHCNIAILISKGSMALISLHKVYAVKKTTFVAILQKSAYYAKYLRISWTDLYLLYRFGSDMGAMIFLTFV